MTPPKTARATNMKKQKITAKTKRVTLSFAFDELHMIDDALRFWADQIIRKQLRSKDNASRMEAAREDGLFGRLRTRRILPLCNRWYDARQKAEEDHRLIKGGR
jgi:hypothetical protein